MESAQQSQAVTITNKAAEKVAEFMKQEGNTNLYLRVYVSVEGVLGCHMEWVSKKNPMMTTA